MEEADLETCEIPIACSLTELELDERRTSALQMLREAVLEVKELDDGFAYRFPSDIVWITTLADLIASEHMCCPFLRFSLNVEAGPGPIWLEMTGAEGTKDFLNSLFS
jgi:hypothetical protein